MVATDTRRRVLDAALVCFLNDGFDQTTIARIRARSGVSNGALFHHFRSKEAIADALYVEAISSFQDGLWEIVRGRPRSLRAAIRAALAHQLSWIEQHPDPARFLYLRGHLDWDTPAGAEVHARNRALAGAIGEWIAPLIRSGEVRQMSVGLVTAIVTGPAHAIARRWLAGQLEHPPTAFVDELADAAWAGLRGKPPTRRAAPASVPVANTGRLRLELIAKDGTVVAAGCADAELELTGAVAAELSTH